jgi:CIC family chloride channel protein
MKSIFHYVSKYMMKWLVVATLVGIGGGISAVVLKNAIDFVAKISGYVPIWVSPVIGGALVCMIYLIDPIAAGFGTNHYVAHVNTKVKELKIKTLFTKLTATAITLGFQGSGGVEGPMLVMGGSLADGVARIPFIKKYFNKDDKRILVICGAAGAIGAIFRSPLGGGIFVVELLYRSSLHYAELFPAMLSSTMGFVIYSMLADPKPLFAIPDYIPNVYNVPFFVLTGILAGVVSLVFMWVFHSTQDLFEKIPLKKFHPILGGALTGMILFFIPKVGGAGNYVIQEMINKPFPIIVLLALLIFKMLATSFTVVSGGSGGLVIPALFIGAISGNAIAHLAAPGDIGLLSSLVISGMAASLASIANVPIAAAMMLVEMVGLRLGIPATLGSIVGYAIGHSKVIYEATSPEQEVFGEMKKWRKLDAEKEEH